MEAKNPEAGRQQWQAFLKEWPLERLEKLTLDEYYTSDKTGFFQWLEVHTQDIGEFNEGPLSAGVRLRPQNQPDKEFNYNVRSDSHRIWFASLGDTAEAAFNTVKKDMLTAVKAAQTGNLSAIKSIKYTPGSLIWKVAFLYQNQDAPCVLPFYRPRQFQQIFPEGKGKSIIERQQTLMSRKGDRDILDYAAQLVKEAKNNPIPDDSDPDFEDGELEQMKSPSPLNQILYGPPGTGKTYHTINKALQILNPALLTTPNISRQALVKAFQDYVAKEQIVFCTFHQSFSYEDFVEGLKAETRDGQLVYRVADGIFKKLCNRARSGRTIANDPFDQALARLKQQCDESEDGRVVMKSVTGKIYYVKYVGGTTALVYPQANPDLKHGHTVNFKHVRALYETGKFDGYNPSYVVGARNYLVEHCDLPPFDKQQITGKESDKFILIIDEINRGNVSRIFGELITLIEPSKRAGADEALSIRLPYSSDTEDAEPFSVPDNVYLIGTMNTADRSLAGLDIALRRRFVFEEMPPKPDELEGIVVNGIGLKPLLEIINQRIEALLDRDHCIGHAYFMHLKDNPEKLNEDGLFAQLGHIFRNQIIPLLQEYFFEDWERIQWVLNDHRKPDPADRFIDEHPMNNTALFGDKVSLPPQSRRWRINPVAFTRPETYLGILKATPPVEPDAP